jgi:hypothetical protein
MEQTIIGYLKDNLGLNGDFMAEYRSLSTKDKEDLRRYAAAEMELLGITIRPAA